MADYNKLSVSELRRKLTQKGLSAEGNKAELVKRLSEAAAGSGSTRRGAGAERSGKKDRLCRSCNSELSSKQLDPERPQVCPVCRQASVEALPEPADSEEE